MGSNAVNARLFSPIIARISPVYLHFVFALDSTFFFKEVYLSPLLSSISQQVYYFCTFLIG